MLYNVVYIGLHHQVWPGQMDLRERTALVLHECPTLSFDVSIGFTYRLVKTVEFLLCFTSPLGRPLRPSFWVFISLNHFSTVDFAGEESNNVHRVVFSFRQKFFTRKRCFIKTRNYFVLIFPHLQNSVFPLCISHRLIDELMANLCGCLLKVGTNCKRY